MNKKQLREYINYCQSYAGNNPNWAESYTIIAPIKAERTVKLLKKYKNSKSKVLDHGCGIGLSLYYLAKYYEDIAGIDMDPKSVEIAKKQFNKLHCNVKVSSYDGKKLPYPDDTFDLVISMEVWEHAPDPDGMLREIKRVLKPDGILHITTANKLWPVEPHYHLPFLSYLPYSLADFYVRITRRARYYHDIRLPTYGEFKKNIEKYFEVEDVTFDMIINYKQYGFEKERGRKIIIIAGILRFIEGLGIRRVMFAILSRFSLGWLLIARKRKL